MNQYKSHLQILTPHLAKERVIIIIIRQILVVSLMIKSHCSTFQVQQTSVVWAKGLDLAIRRKCMDHVKIAAINLVSHLISNGYTKIRGWKTDSYHWNCFTSKLRLFQPFRNKCLNYLNSWKRFKKSLILEVADHHL